MKALDEYFLIAVFPLLLNRVNVFANFMFNMDRETRQGNRHYAQYEGAFYYKWTTKLAWNCPITRHYSYESQSYIQDASFVGNSSV